RVDGGAGFWGRRNSGLSKRGGKRGMRRELLPRGYLPGESLDPRVLTHVRRCRGPRPSCEAPRGVNPKGGVLQSARLTLLAGAVTLTTVTSRGAHDPFGTAHGRRREREGAEERSVDCG